MVGCDVKGCKQWFYTERGLNIHKARGHNNPRVPDLIGMGIIKRKLTPIESKQVTKEVMAMGLDADARFTMAIIKAMEVTNK